MKRFRLRSPAGHHWRQMSSSSRAALVFGYAEASCCSILQQQQQKKNKRKGREPEPVERSYSLVGAGTESASGITGLSQISYIPRYDSEGDINTAHPTTVPSTSPSDHSTTTTIFNTNNNKNNKKTKQNGCCGKCGRYVRAFFRGFISLVGLSLLVAGYAIGGGFLFAYLESGNEILIREDVVKVRERVVEILWNTTEELNILHEEEWKLKAEEILGQFQREMYQLINSGWDGAEVGQQVTSWTVGASLLFSITVITTIGYGNVTPKTIVGRYSTIAYAIVGIPLCLIWLTSVGGVMASIFRFIYRKLVDLCLCLTCRKRSRKNKRRNKNTDGDGVERAEPSKRGGRRDKKDEEGKEVRVPLFVSLLILVSYIMLGAILFSTWEGWELSVAAYFCFVTLSTIGFGDYVPGFGTDMNEGKAIGNAAYLILGLALLAMCFDLMREEVTLTFRNLAQRFSSLTSDNPDRSTTTTSTTPTTATTSTSKARKRDAGRGHQHGTDRGVEKPLLLKEETAGRTASKKPIMVSSSQPHAPPKPLQDVGRGEKEEAIPTTPVQSRPNTVAASSSANALCGPMPQTSLESDSGRTLPGVTSSSSNIDRNNTTNNNNSNNNNNNNNNSSLSNKNSGVEGGWGEPPVPRSVSVPPQVLGDTIDLLEHMSLSRRSSSPGSVQVRHRSRSPVRSRPKSRGPGTEDRGGNVDVPTEEEEEEEDDDDTLFAESMASSTDLVKMAHALRKERQQELPPPPPPEPTVSPTSTLTSDDTAPLPAVTHPYNNTSMTTFRPPPTGGGGGGGGGGGREVGSATPGPQTSSAFLLTPTPSRAVSQRCPSHARTSSTGSRSYFQG